MAWLLVLRHGAENATHQLGEVLPLLFEVDGRGKVYDPVRTAGWVRWVAEELERNGERFDFDRFLRAAPLLESTTGLERRG